MSTVDDVVELIYQWLPRPDALEPVVITRVLGGNQVEVLRGSGRQSMLYALAVPAVVPGCAWAEKLGTGWAVVLSNFQAPLPPGPYYAEYYVVDGGPGPDGYWGTADDEAGAGQLITEDGQLVVEG